MTSTELRVKLQRDLINGMAEFQEYKISLSQFADQIISLFSSQGDRRQITRRDPESVQIAVGFGIPPGGFTGKEMEDKRQRERRVDWHRIAKEAQVMIESAVSHVSHGGPTAEEAEQWLAKFSQMEAERQTGGK